MNDLPENYNICDYDRPSVAVDIAAFTIRKTPCESYRHLSGASLSVLMVRRGMPPYKDCLSLPGGFAVRTETIEETARRKLYEKTGVTGLPLSLLYNSSALGRDPRGWIISCGYWSVVECSRAVITEDNAAWYDVRLADDEGVLRLELVSGDGSITAAKLKISGSTSLYNEAVKIETVDSSGIAFDHAEIIVRAVLQLRSSLEQPYAAFRLVPESFTLTELQQVYEAVLDKPLLMANFRRKIMPYVEETGVIETGAGHRPSKLYRAVKHNNI